MEWMYDWPLMLFAPFAPYDDDVVEQHVWQITEVGKGGKESEKT